jgi:hypothetical protein
VKAFKVFSECILAHFCLVKTFCPMTSGVLHVSLHSKSASWIGFVFTTENRGCGLNRHIFAVLAPTKRAETQSAWRACACRVFVHFYPRVSECVWWFPRWHWKRRRHSVFSVENRVLHFASTSTQKAEYIQERQTPAAGVRSASSCMKWIVSRERLVVSHEFPGSEKLFPVAAPPDCRINAKNLIILSIV